MTFVLSTLFETCPLQFLVVFFKSLTQINEKKETRQIILNTKRVKFVCSIITNIISALLKSNYTKT